MAQRNEEDYEARKQQIIDGALEVFSHRGFEKATNKEIARAAGIGSPGLIYHYFLDKADLYRKVLQQRIPLLQLVANPQELEALPLAEALTRFGDAYLKLLDSPNAISLVRLIVSDAVRHPHVADLFWQAGPTHALNFLASYFEHQMDAGRLRRTDPMQAALSFMGPLIIFVVSRTLFKQAPTHHMDARALLTHTVTTFLHGMQAENGPPAPTV